MLHADLSVLLKDVFCQGLILGLLGLPRDHEHACIALFLFADVRCEVLDIVGLAVKTAVILVRELCTWMRFIRRSV